MRDRSGQGMVWYGRWGGPIRPSKIKTMARVLRINLFRLLPSCWTNILMLDKDKAAEVSET